VRLAPLREERILAKPPTNGSEIGERIVHILFVEYHVAVHQAASHLMDREVDSEVVSHVSHVREGREKMAEGT
jgi:hypothetical protein